MKIEISEKKKLGKKIKLLRIDKDLTQEEMAHNIGAYRYQVSQWENGLQIIPTKYLFEICQKFDINLDYFDIYKKPQGGI